MNSILKNQPKKLYYWMIGGDQKLRNTCKKQLNKHGHLIDCFESVENAQNAILNQAKSPDIYLIDLQLPDQSGLVLSWILQKLNPTSKIIFLSTNPNIETEHDPLTPISLQSPPDIEKLLQVSNELVNRSKNHLALFYENENHFYEMALQIAKDAVPDLKCLLLVLNREEMLEKLKMANVDLKHTVVNTVTRYLRRIWYDIELIALCINFFEKAMKENYKGICIIIDHSAFLSDLNDLRISIKKASFSLVTHLLQGTHYLVCAYSLNDLAPHIRNIIIKNHDATLNGKNTPRDSESLGETIKTLIERFRFSKCSYPHKDIK